MAEYTPNPADYIKVQIRDALVEMINNGLTVKGVGIEVTADIITADVNALVNGIVNGIANAKTIADLHTLLTTMAGGKTLTDLTTALAILTGSALTFTPVSITQAVAGTKDLLAKSETKIARLHLLFGTMTVAGTVQIQDQDGEAVTGPMTVGANGGLVLPFVANPNGVPRASGVNKGLQLVSVTGGFNGFAIVSEETIT